MNQVVERRVHVPCWVWPCSPPAPLCAARARQGRSAPRRSQTRTWRRPGAGRPGHSTGFTSLSGSDLSCGHSQGSSSLGQRRLARPDGLASILGSAEGHRLRRASPVQPKNTGCTPPASRLNRRLLRQRRVRTPPGARASAEVLLLQTLNSLRYPLLSRDRE